jgi:hypothetical protein
MRTVSSPPASAGLAALALAAFAAAASAGVPGSRQAEGLDRIVGAQLESIRSVGEGEGFSQSFEDRFDQLDHQASVEHVFELEFAREYFIAAACDEGCSNINLQLKDENGYLVALDDAPDDAPLVKVLPRWSGPFHLTVTMAECQAAPCRYGIKVMAR